jgi:hypothetical protein
MARHEWPQERHSVPNLIQELAAGRDAHSMLSTARRDRCKFEGAGPKTV